MNDESQSDPSFHVKRMRQQFQEQVDHLRADIKVVNDPQAKAMFETSAEVLTGLIKAFDDYENKTEEAWKK